MEEMRIAQEILKTLKETTQSELFCDLAHRAEPIILATREFTMICDLAQLYRERGLWREGEYVLQAAVKFEPSQPDPHRALGLLFLHRDDLPWEQSLKRAVEAFETSVRLERLTSESSPATHSLLGRALFALGQADRAETELRNALRIDPEYAEAKYNLATVLSSLENPPLTMIHDLLSQCTRDDPDYAPAFRDLGWHLRYSDPPRAESYLTRALSLDQNDPLAHLYFARLKIDSDPGTAEKHYKKAIDLDPADGELHRLLGLFYKHHARNQEANRELFLAVESDPHDISSTTAYIGFLRNLPDRETAKNLYSSVVSGSILPIALIEEIENQAFRKNERQSEK